MDNTENAREAKENLESVEKPKKKLSEAQLKNLEKMRHKRSVQAEAKKIIKKNENKESTIAPNFVGANASPDYSNQFLKLSEDMEYIKQYIQNKQKIKTQKVKKENSVDKSTREEEEENYNYLIYQQNLRSNFLR